MICPSCGSLAQGNVCAQCGSAFLGSGESPARLGRPQAKRPNPCGWPSSAQENFWAADPTGVAHGGLSEQEQRERDLAEFLAGLREARISPPTLEGEFPLLLRGWEKVIYSLPGITLIEAHSIPEEARKDPGIGMSSGVAIQESSFSADLYERMEDIDQGTLILSNKRLAFAGADYATATDLTKLISVDAYSDAVAVRRMGEENTELYLGLDQHSYQFTVEDRRIRRALLRSLPQIHHRGVVEDRLMGDHKRQFVVLLGSRFAGGRPLFQSAIIVWAFLIAACCHRAEWTNYHVKGEERGTGHATEWPPRAVAASSGG